GGQRLDGERFGIALQQIDGALADRAGRTENGHSPRLSGLTICAIGRNPKRARLNPTSRGHRHANTLPPPINVNSATAGITAKRPSSRSRRPPCPGMRPLESFTPNLRLATDSARSPNCSTIASPALSKTKGSTDAPSRQPVAQPATP